MSNKIDNSFAARNIDFTQDNSLANFDWKRNDLVNKFVLDSPYVSSDNFDLEDESRDEDDDDQPRLSHATHVIQNIMIAQTINQKAQTTNQKNKYSKLLFHK